jgi:hypothetical protein
LIPAHVSASPTGRVGVVIRGVSVHHTNSALWAAAKRVASKVGDDMRTLLLPPRITDDSRILVTGRAFNKPAMERLFAAGVSPAGQSLPGLDAVSDAVPVIVAEAVKWEIESDVLCSAGTV